ncbi:hypothetical protein BD94_1094 [Elizabethkingia anophelis NUHP1]|uniref:Uncharacterized protein n=1 Tax=Elizabethkingia anophelis NUHP1 TaxID=1338011 RepID=A0A077EFB8_9FLAO|nr:hypothetical protein BD94_1094 [Elizabethkingia anophelis NUHP1]
MKYRKQLPARCQVFIFHNVVYCLWYLQADCWLVYSFCLFTKN